MLFAFVTDVVLKQDTNNTYFSSISLYDCLSSSVELGEKRSWQKSCGKFVNGLLLYIYSSERNILV